MSSTTGACQACGGGDIVPPSSVVTLLHCKIVESYKKYLSYDMEVYLSTPFQPYIGFYC